MNIIEKQFGRQSALYIPAELYPIEIAKAITSRLGIDPDDVSSYLQVFFDRCAEDLRAYKFDQMPPRAAQLELDLRQAKLAMSRPDPDRVHALRQSEHARGAAAGWTSEEIDAARAMANPSAIANIDWRGARTTDGRELSRESIREGMRSAAYSDAGWRKYLATLPPIAAPETL